LIFTRKCLVARVHATTVTHVYTMGSQLIQSKDRLLFLDIQRSAGKVTARSLWMEVDGEVF